MIKRSIAAGISISLACIASIESGNRIAGAVFFSVGLVAVILLDLDLFTGRVAYARWGNLLKLFVIFGYNVMTAFLCGALYRACGGEVNITLRVFAPWYTLLLKGALCGALIYIAYHGYRKTKSVLAIVLPVSAFVISGGEHCIANAFYSVASALPFWDSLTRYILLSALGNSLGAITMRLLSEGKSV